MLSQVQHHSNMMFNIHNMFNSQRCCCCLDTEKKKQGRHWMKDVLSLRASWFWTTACGRGSPVNPGRCHFGHLNNSHVCWHLKSALFWWIYEEPAGSIKGTQPHWFEPTPGHPQWNQLTKEVVTYSNMNSEAYRPVQHRMRQFGCIALQYTK